MARRREFSDGYNWKAVRLAAPPGMTKNRVGGTQGIHARLLGRWCRDCSADGAAAFPGMGKPRDEEWAASWIVGARWLARRALMVGHDPWLVTDDPRRTSDMPRLHSPDPKSRSQGLNPTAFR